MLSDLFEHKSLDTLNQIFRITPFITLFLSLYPSRLQGLWLIWESNLIWAAARQNQQNDLSAQLRLRSAWAQSDQRLCCPHEETLGP